MKLSKLLEKRSCPVCRSDNFTNIRTVPADAWYQSRFGISTATIVKCEDCYTKYTNPILNEQCTNALYTESTGYNINDVINPETLVWTDQKICLLELMANLENPSLDSVLDFGCGGGGLVFLGHKYKLNIHGIEIDKDRVAKATKLGILNISNTIISNIPDSSFKAICCLHVFEHLQCCINIAREFTRVLQPGGFVIIIVPNPEALSFLYKKQDYWTHPFEHRNALTRNSLDRLFFDAGFQKSNLRTGWQGSDIISRKDRVSLLITKFGGNWLKFYPTKLICIYKKS